MEVRIKGKSFIAGLEDESTRTSISTGRRLRRVQANITVWLPEDHEVTQALSERDGTALLVDDGHEVECDVKVLRSSYTDGDPRRHYLLELEEREDLVLQSLEVVGHDLVPDGYKEDTRHDILTCHVRATLPREVLEHFWGTRGAKGDAQYFAVRRSGISDEPRAMRFGRILWSEQTENPDLVDVSFVLVDKTYDDDPENRFSLRGPNEQAVQQSTAKLEVVIDRLLDLLASRSILSNTELQQLRAEVDEAAYKRELDYYRVADLTEWD